MAIDNVRRRDADTHAVGTQGAGRAMGLLSKSASRAFVDYLHNILLILNMLFFCLIVLVSPFAEGVPLLAESDRPATCATEQSPVPLSLAEESSDNLPIILTGVGRDQCWGRCDSDLRFCVNRCPGFDESNVVDPKYAARKCKNACDTVLSKCKSGCPDD
jgi:hypothetical protein